MEEDRTEARDVPVDRRASELGVQLEQVRVTLHQLRQTNASLHDVEARLADMTRECAGILDRWAKNDEKHAAAVVELHGRLSEWNDIERRLLNESATRVHQFERSLQNEWTALKQKHEAPLEQLEAQSARVAEMCLTAVDQALKGFDRAEARLEAIEQQLQREMADLVREVRGAIAELRQGQAIGTRQPWSLDNVVRLHNELREEDGSPEGGPALAAASGTLALAPTVSRAPRVVPGAALAESGPQEAARSPFDTQAAPEQAARRWGPAMVAAIVFLLVMLAGYGFYLRRQVDAGLRDAAARAEAAERDALASRDLARQEIAAARQDADARLASAERTASAAQRLATIVAAPDAKRFDLSAAGAPTPVAQVLWSRTHGVAVSAARLPRPPDGRAYQLWFATRTTPVSVGLVAANPAGATSAVFAWPQELRRAVTGAFVTLEPASGSRQPTASAWITSSDPAPARTGS